MEHFTWEQNAACVCVCVVFFFSKEYIKSVIQDIYAKACFMFIIQNTVFATGYF